MTVDEFQHMVDQWITTTGGGYFDPLTNTAVLAEETGEVARVMARVFGMQRPKSTDDCSKERLADELADLLWVTAAIANQTGVNLTEAISRNLLKKNLRDKNRFKQHPQ